MVICLEKGADLHMAQLMPLPLTVSCLSKMQTGFTFLVPAHLGSPGQRAVKQVCVCVCSCYFSGVVPFIVCFQEGDCTVCIAGFYGCQKFLARKDATSLCESVVNTQHLLTSTK